MRQQIVSRSERRIEKKQTITFLALVLAVSLVSFALGVMVGRVSSSSEIAHAPAAVPERVAVAVEPPPPAPASDPPRANSQEELTFFDTLPKGEQSPMGSGINLPPQARARQEDPIQGKTSPPPSERAPAPSATPAAVSPSSSSKEVRAALPASSIQGTYTLQVASFQDPSDAIRLQDRLASRGYSSYTEQADLGNKGVWTRVFVGPYDSDQAATTAASRLLGEEKISALIRRK